MGLSLFDLSVLYTSLASNFIDKTSFKMIDFAGVLNLLIFYENLIAT